MKNNKYKILIVDDNDKNIQIIAYLLSKNNYNVDYALNGLDALELIKSENFDLILLDIMMPNMDGYELCERILKDKKNNEIPIIFLTAKTDIESIKKAFNYGGLDYISKPFNNDELLSRVKTHVELKIIKEKLREVNKRLEEKVLERTSELLLAYENVSQLKKGYNKEKGYCFFDGMLSKVLKVSKRKEFVIYHTSFGYIVKKECFTSHGNTIKKAIIDLNFKIASEKLKNNPIYENTIITVDLYRIVTGACEFGCRDFMTKHNIPFDVKNRGASDETTLMTTELKAKDLFPLLQKDNAYGFEKFKSLVQFDC
jgi:CheY-like chemotaxis protein